MRKIRKSVATILVCLLMLGGLGAGGAVWFVGPERSLDYLASETGLDLRPWFYEPWYETEEWERPAPSPWQKGYETPAAETSLRSGSEEPAAPHRCRADRSRSVVRIETPRAHYRVTVLER